VDVLGQVRLRRPLRALVSALGPHVPGAAWGLPRFGPAATAAGGAPVGAARTATGLPRTAPTVAARPAAASPAVATTVHALSHFSVPCSDLRCATIVPHRRNRATACRRGHHRSPRRGVVQPPAGSCSV